MAEVRLWVRLRRHLLILGAVLTVMLLVMYGGATVYQGQVLRSALSQAEQNWGSLRPRETPPPATPDAANAAVPVFAAAMMHELDTSRIPAMNRVKRGVREVGAERADLQAIVDANAEPLRLLDEALARPQVDWRIEPPPGAHFMGDGPPYSFILPLASTNWVSGRLAVADGDAAAALQAFQRHLLLSRAVGARPELLPQVLRLRIAARALDLVHHMLAHLTVDEAGLRLLRAQLDAMPGAEALHAGMVSEFKEMTRLYLAAVEGEPWPGAAGEGAARQDLNAIAVAIASRPLRGESPIRSEDVEALGGGAARWLLRPALRSRVAAYVRDSDDLLRRQQQAPHQRLRDMSGGSGEVSEENSGWLARLLPDMRMERQLLDMGDLMQARLVLARASVALAQWRQATGSCPETLEQLVPSVLAAIPEDPLSGSPLVYRKQEAGCSLSSLEPQAEASLSRKEPWGPRGLLSWSLGG